MYEQNPKILENTDKTTKPYFNKNYIPQSYKNIVAESDSNNTTKVIIFI